MRGSEATVRIEDVQVTARGGEASGAAGKGRLSIAAVAEGAVVEWRGARWRRGRRAGEDGAVYAMGAMGGEKGNAGNLACSGDRDLATEQR